jgi:hypothetical protein
VGRGTTRVLALALLSACHGTNIDTSRVERAMGITFANLVEVQERLMGAPAISAEALHASATCHRTGPGARATGSGDWSCTVAWGVPGRRGALRDTYELSITGDGCFTASADATEAHVGGPTLKTPKGETVPNLLYVFNGCFDPT